MGQKKTVLCLGRIGDILNALPLAYYLSRKGEVNFCVSKDFTHVLERVPYVTPLVFDGPYNKPLKAQQWLRTMGIKDPVVCQTHGYLGAEIGKSYQKAAWVAAGESVRFGSEPLILDAIQKLEALQKSIWFCGRIGITVSFESVSSPFPNRDAYIRLLMESFPDITIWDTKDCRLSNPVDMVAIYNLSEVLVSVDTMHLHLCRAAQVPVVAIINDGWKGSVPPPNAVSTIRYADVTPEKVVDAVRSVLDAKKKKGKIFLKVNPHGTSPRHLRAHESWRNIPELNTIPYFVGDGRSSKKLGDARELPYLKDVIGRDWNDDDIVIWTNDDVFLDPKIVEWCHSHVAVFGASTMRRNEEGHVGRELFAFTGKWIKENFDSIPDYFIGEEQFDLGMAALIRKQRGILTTLENLRHDFYPCDASERYALHEPHEGEWENKRNENSPAKKHNKKLFAEWLSKHQGHLKFS